MDKCVQSALHVYYIDKSDFATQTNNRSALLLKTAFVFFLEGSKWPRLSAATIPQVPAYSTVLIRVTVDFCATEWLILAFFVQVLVCKRYLYSRISGLSR